MREEGGADAGVRDRDQQGGERCRRRRGPEDALRGRANRRRSRDGEAEEPAVAIGAGFVLCMRRLVMPVVPVVPVVTVMVVVVALRLLHMLPVPRVRVMRTGTTSHGVGGAGEKEQEDRQPGG
ncbi:MAG: hypothetical protein EA350_09530 [Gemmatimonadales bacterium]|nr:MAG: hypothetical protein EA350_09530 [Gemmatimonadales bacterium]